MSKELALTKKQKALVVKSKSSFEIAVCEIKSVLKDLKTEIETAPVISLESGDFKQPDAMGWQMKISNKIIRVFGQSCRDIDNIQNVFYRTWLEISGLKQPKSGECLNRLVITAKQLTTTFFPSRMN